MFDHLGLNRFLTVTYPTLVFVSFLATWASSNSVVRANEFHLQVSVPLVQEHSICQPVSSDLLCPKEGEPFLATKTSCKPDSPAELSGCEKSTAGEFFQNRKGEL